MNVKRMPFFIIFFGAVFELLIVPLFFIWCLITRIHYVIIRRKKLPNIFMGTMHINNWVYVARALKNKGYKVKLVVWNPPAHEIGSVQYDIILSKFFPILFRFKILRYFVQIWLFLWAVRCFDIFIMCFQGRLLDRTVILRWADLPLLKIAGKKIVLNTYGADIMTPRMTLGKRYKYSIVEGYVADENYAHIDEGLVRENRIYCQKWADVIISAIDHVQYLNRVDEYFHMRCIDLNEYTLGGVTKNAIPIIVHAPNHRLLKGTEYLVKAVDDLNKEGIKCQLKIIENQPHNELLKELSQADIAADQFLVGAYARFSIEAMAMCKPVLCYLREDLFPFNPIWTECPIINTNPDNIKEQLKMLILKSPEERSEIGRKGRAYVKKYHSMEYIGDRLDKIINRLWNK